MKNKAAGTYDFGNFEENQKELERLKKQAAIGVEYEKRIWQQTGLQDCMDIIDLACGPGITASAMAEFVPEANVIGIDINDLLLQEAIKAHPQQCGKNLSFQKGDVYDLDLPESSYDYVYARFLFQHLHDPLRAIKNIKKILRPGGKLVLVDVDDHFLMIHPESEDFKTFTALAAEEQKNAGGDRFVGRKFHSFLHEASFTEASCSVLPVTTNEIGKDTFIAITTGFKSEQIRSKGNKVEGYLKNIYSDIEKPNAWGIACVFIGVGVN